MTTQAEADTRTAIAHLGAFNPIAFWRKMHDCAVAAAVGFSPSRFAELEADAQNSAFRDEPWLPHVEAVVSEAARIRRTRS